MRDTIEDQVITYCQQRGIPIKDGQVPPEYKAEINEFVKMQSEKNKASEKESGMKIGNILKDVMPKAHK